MWITLHGIPNETHLDQPRLALLVNTDCILLFSHKPGETTTHVHWRMDQTASLEVAESMKEITALLQVDRK